MALILLIGNEFFWIGEIMLSKFILGAALLSISASAFAKAANPVKAPEFSLTSCQLDDATSSAFDSSQAFFMPQEPDLDLQTKGGYSFSIQLSVPNPNGGTLSDMSTAEFTRISHEVFNDETAKLKISYDIYRSSDKNLIMQIKHQDGKSVIEASILGVARTGWWPDNSGIQYAMHLGFICQTK